MSCFRISSSIARLLEQEKRGVVLVPSAAVQRNSQNTYVYVVKPDSTVTVRQVPGGDQRRYKYGDHFRRRRRRRGGADGRRQAAGRQQGDGSPGGRVEPGKADEVSPSRTFILRPVATTLLMVGILLAGAVAYHELPVSALPEVDYPTIQVTTFLSGGESGRDGFVGDGATGAPVRPGAGAAADDVDQLRRAVGHHAAVQSEPEHRCRRAGSAAVDQCLGNLSAGRSSDAAALQQNQSGRYADSDAGADVETNCRCRRWRIWRTRGWRRRFRSCRRGAGQHQRRTEAGGAHPGESDASWLRTA